MASMSDYNWSPVQQGKRLGIMLSRAISQGGVHWSFTTNARASSCMRQIPYIGGSATELLEPDRQRKFDKEFGAIAPGEHYVRDFHASYKKRHIGIQVGVPAMPRHGLPQLTGLPWCWAGPAVPQRRVGVLLLGVPQEAGRVQVRRHRRRPQAPQRRPAPGPCVCNQSMPRCACTAKGMLSICIELAGVRALPCAGSRSSPARGTNSRT
jgi:hypothetical protein